MSETATKKKKRFEQFDRPDWIGVGEECRILLNKTAHTWIEAVIVNVTPTDATVRYKIAPLFTDETTEKRVGFDRLRKI